MKLSFCLTVLLAHSGCVRSSTVLPPTELGTVDASLGPGDAFDVRVFGEKELSGDYQVANDGSIFFPLIGRLHVAGKDSHVVSEEIATALKQKDILRDPHVTVRVRETMSKRFSVLGAVAKPGTLSMVPGMTIVQAISQAGGFTPLASKDETVVTRRSGGKLNRYRVVVTEITRGNADDFVVSPGDIIFVPERVF